MKRAALIFIAFIIGMFAHIGLAFAASRMYIVPINSTDFDYIAQYPDPHYTANAACGSETYVYYSQHEGMDFILPEGTPVYAAASGTVTRASESCSSEYCYGNYLYINHGSNNWTLYAHLSSYVVSSGAYVSQGDLIAYSGSTGTSTPHLHWEVVTGSSAVSGSPNNPYYCDNEWFTTNPPTYADQMCTDHTYPINLLTISQNSSTYDFNGYYTDESGTSIELYELESLMADDVGAITNHKGWASGDVDGDSDDDIVEVLDNGSYTYVYVYKSDGTGSFGSRTQWAKTTTGVFTSSTSGVNTIFLEDMDNDSDSDLIMGWRNSDNTMKWKTYTSTGSSFGGTTNGVIWSSSFGNYLDLFQIGDYKDNGKGELLCGREADGTNNYTFSSALTWKRLSSTGGVTTVATGYGYSGDAFFSVDVNSDDPEDLVRVDLYDSTVSVYMEQYSSSSSAFGSASKLATDVGGTDGSYFFYPLNSSDSYPDLMRLNTSGELYLSLNASGSSLTTQSLEYTVITGMPTSDAYLFGDFGTTTVCE
ncbi:MAG: M23 family metallopeptidase [Candidatus Kerfeldbacteria bacterium]|nr:M23 family metallopeptidase [Candidatus Kerfeldbacteria bacterium]